MSPYRSLYLLLTLLVVCPMFGTDCQRTFATPVRYGLDRSPLDLAAADFDSDGHPDIAVAGVGGVTLLLHRTDGFVPGANVSFPSTPRRLFPVDANGDGRQDLVTYGSGFLATLFANGDGTFRTVSSAFSGDTLLSTTPVAFADFDGNGRPDLAFAFLRGNGSAVRVFSAAADGTFTEPKPATPWQPRVRQIAAAELTSDGKMDLAIVDGGNLTILPGNGDATFGAAQSLRLTTATTLIAGDFDTDGRADLMFGAMLLLSSRGYADPRFPNLSGGGTVVDLDGDGRMDMLSASVVHRGLGDGTFTQVSAGPVVTNSSGHAFADFDGDGRLDVVSGTAMNEVALRYGRGGGLLDGGSSFAAGSLLHAMFTNDVNGDGRDDLVAVSAGYFQVYISDPDGTLRLANTLGTQPVGEAAAMGDFNNDGKLDLFLAKAGVAFGAGDGTFAAPVGLDERFTETDAAAGDFNGDGKLDVVIALDQSKKILRLLGDGSGQFTEAITPTTAQSIAVAVADFNHDGRADIVATTMSTTSDSNEGPSLNLIDGASPAVAVKIAEQIDPSDITAADVDGDDNPDVLAFSQTGDQLLIFGGNGNGTFRAPRAISVDGGMRGAVTVADFDRDGRADIVVTREDALAAALFLQRADGSFAESARIPNGHWYGAASGDFDDDGFPDLVLAASSPTSIVYAHLNRCRDELRVYEPHVRLDASRRTLSVELPSDAQGSVTFSKRLRSEEYWKHAAFVTVPVVNGRASLQTTLPAGEYVFSAAYSGQGRYAHSDAAPIVHTLTDESAPPRRRRVRH